MPEPDSGTVSPRRVARRLRRAATRAAVAAAMRIAAFAPERSLRLVELAARRCLAHLGPLMPLAARTVRDNMRRAGVWRTGADSRWFEQVARHLAAAMYVFRHAHDAVSNGRPAPLAAMSRERVMVDDSISHLRDAVARGRGVILACPHTCQFLWALARLNQETPLAVYLRFSRHPHGRAAKEAWCRAAGLSMIAEPSRIADPTARAERLADALRGGRTLVITPDVAQRLDRGVRVRLLGRRVSMASGVAALAVLTGAPVVMGLSMPQGDRIRTAFYPPIEPADAPRRSGWRRAAMSDIQQRWTDHFSEFIRQYPEMWWMGLDSRWTRVFRGDPAYSEASAP